MSSERSSIIISVFSTTPGIGKTITAINLSAGLAAEGYRVCLVDLDLQFGDVMNYLQLTSSDTIARAQRELQEEPDSFNVTKVMHFSIRLLIHATFLDINVTGGFITRLHLRVFWGCWSSLCK